MRHVVFFPGIRAILSALLICHILWSGQAEAQARDVTPQTLQAELMAAAPGTTLRLAPGNYGSLSMRGGGGLPGAPLILMSADPANPAILQEVYLRDVQYITLETVLFDYTYEPGDAPTFKPFQIIDSVSIVIRNSLFDGDEARGLSVTDNGFGTAFGLSVRGTRGFTFEDNEIRGFYRGLIVSQCQDILIRGNDLHDMRMDGMNFAEVVALVIEDNHIHDFNRSLDSGDHADMIQFWTGSTSSPSRDITIRNNVLNSGEGWYTQSIFIRNELVDTGRAGDEMFYRNIVIEHNVILNAHAHGITVGETDGLRISNNTLVRNASSEGPQANPNLWTPQIRVSTEARNVDILRNVTAKIAGQQAQVDWNVRDNLFVQDRGRMEPGFYGVVFDRQVLVDSQTISSFVPRPGGPLDGANIGAARLQN